MFEKIGRAAEKSATRVNLSRRGFLGRLARWSGSAALAVTALLTTPKAAFAFKGLCNGGAGFLCTRRGVLICYFCQSDPGFGFCQTACLESFVDHCHSF